MSGLTRRGFVGSALAAAFLAGCSGSGGGDRSGGGGRVLSGTGTVGDPVGGLFTISLAQWSLHRMLKSGGLDHLDFPAFSRSEFGIDAVEYVNTFFKKKGESAYIGELKRRCDDAGVKSLLIMCDGEGNLGDADPVKRLKAVENHYKWVDAARQLGCHSIRVNAQSSGTYLEQQERAADGLRRLCVFADGVGINVIVENHWGLSSHGEWLVGVMKRVAHPRIGTLPDFGNFDPKQYDRYKGVQDLMPWARGVSAKSYDFDAAGETSRIDYRRMMKIVLDAGYRGSVGIEYEGSVLPEVEGVKATWRLLRRVGLEYSKSKG